MDIKIRRIYRTIYLSDYFGEGEDTIEVWANPPRDLRAEWTDIREESNAVTKDLVALSKRKKKPTDEERKALTDRFPLVNDRFYGWFAKLWKFDGKEVAAEDIREFAIKCEKEDEALWLWLINATWSLINDQRELVKKG